MLEDLLPTALLGTRSAPKAQPALPDDIAALVAEMPPATPESQLLAASAAVALYARAGAKTRTGIPRPSRAEPDELPECSPRAAGLLARLLEEKTWDLLSEWLRLASQPRRRPPASRLPQLLDAAAAHRPLREAVLRVIDRRGHWLTQFNASWNFAAQAPADDVWQTGNKDQRGFFLRELRASDPAKARAMVASTWPEDPADERERWLAELRVGLGAEDETFLESCLDDRSSKVRDAAADLLARLPESAFVRRMIERVAPLVAFSKGAAGNLLRMKRSAPNRIAITLPESFDKSMLRDCIKEKPTETIGQKQWWFLQMASYIPLSHWTERFGVGAADLIAALPDEFGDILLRGWNAAFARIPQSDWAVPLVSARSSAVPFPDGLLAAIPAEHRAALVERLLQLWQSGRQLWPGHMIDAWRPLDEATSTALVRHCGLPELLTCDACRAIHPAALDLLESRLVADTEVRGKKLDQAITEIALRREMHQELSS